MVQAWPSVKITATAGKVCFLSNGGNTDTGDNPGGTSPKDRAKSGFEKSFGRPPPYWDPGWATNAGAFPGNIPFSGVLDSKVIEANAIKAAKADPKVGFGLPGSDVAYGLNPKPFPSIKMYFNDYLSNDDGWCK